MDADGKSDPYVKVDVDGHSLQVTKIMSKTLNPVWDEKFIFVLEPDQVIVLAMSYLPYARESSHFAVSLWD